MKTAFQAWFVAVFEVNGFSGELPMPFAKPLSVLTGILASLIKNTKSKHNTANVISCLYVDYGQKLLVHGSPHFEIFCSHIGTLTCTELDVSL